MPWKLRQFFEGDRTITVSEVASSGECWVDGEGDYVPDSIAIKINGVEYPLEEVGLEVGFLVIQVPTGVYIGKTTTVQVYALCETDPEFTTTTLTSKNIGFGVYNGVIKACNPQIILNSTVDDYIRFYLTESAGDYFNAKRQGNALTLSDFSYQAGDSGNITVTAGNFSRPTTFASPASLISNGIYGGSPILSITPLSTKYFTARLGFIEVIFNGTQLLYNNYMIGSEFEVSIGTYVPGDIINIESTPSNYVIKKNGTVLATKVKNISYTVTGGTVVPSSSQIGVPVVWNVPGTAGDYTFTATVGDAIQIQQTVRLHSCADAVNDDFTGVYNTAFSGNVSTNDTICVGENTYFTVQGTPTGGIVVLNANGTFTFTPTTNFNGAASFQYNIRCGDTLESSEITDTATATINYFDICNGVVANWQDSGITRCQDCEEEKQQIDLNAQCTGNQPRWVSNPSGSACSSSPNYVATGEKRCQNCVNQLEEQDLNTCSSTYLTKRWITDFNGTICDLIPNWVNNGSFRCQNCVEEMQQTDTKSCSPTYNQTRWVNNPNGTQCNRIPNWQDTNEFLCINCVEYKQQQDENLCSPTYLQVRNVTNPGGTVCDATSEWVDTGITRCNNGVHEKQQQATNACAEVSIRWIATGLQLCGCIVDTNFKKVCREDDLVTGITVYKQGVVESNRLISFTQNTFSFKADEGTFTYIVMVSYQIGVPTRIIYNHKCQPLY